MREKTIQQHCDRISQGVLSVFLLAVAIGTASYLTSTYIVDTGLSYYFFRTAMWLCAGVAVGIISIVLFIFNTMGKR